MSEATVHTVAQPDERYRKSERLQKRSDFLRVQAIGERFSTPRVVVIAAPSPKEGRRFGVTVSSKVGNSVVRSLVKRRLREIFRRDRLRWPEGYDYVVIARNAAAEASYEDLTQDIESWAAWYARRLARAQRKSRAAESAEE